MKVIAAFVVGVIVGLGVAAILHGLLDGCVTGCKRKRTADAATSTDR